MHLFPHFHLRRKYPLQTIIFCSILLLSILAVLVLVPGSLPEAEAAQANQTNHAATHQAADSSFYTDTALVIDNVNLIQTHDPQGYRYTAAQLYVNLAPAGDRIGLAEITSSPTPKKILDLQNMDSNGKTLVNQKLNSFGPVDTHPTAYFTPALQAAKDILTNGNTDTNRKYVVIVTDVQALSGDPGPCPDSPDQYHNWFCTARDLESAGITVILIGFSKPGSEGEFTRSKDYIQSHGGIVLQVDDGANVAERLAQTYTELLTRTHPNIFLGKFNGTPNTVTIGADDKLIGLTFMGLGPLDTSLSDIETPTNQQIAGQNSSGSYSTATGRGYWLETITTGDLVGNWRLKAGNGPPDQVYVLGISEGNFELLNPVPLIPIARWACAILRQGNRSSCGPESSKRTAPRLVALPSLLIQAVAIRPSSRTMLFLSPQYLIARKPISVPFSVQLQPISLPWD